MDLGDPGAFDHCSFETRRWADTAKINLNPSFPFLGGPSNSNLYPGIRLQYKAFRLCFHLAVAKILLPAS